MLGFLKAQRRALEDRLAARGLSHTLSLARARLHRRLGAVIDAHASGRCLDAGSGHSPFKQRLRARGADVVSVDVEDRAGEIDLVADIQAMPDVPDASFDTAICTQVLEHVPRPWEAMGELARVLKPGGTLIVSVPHLSVMHEVPHDYYRYTEFGLRALAERAGFEVVEIRATGGLICFLAHGVSGVLMSTLGALPLLRWPVWLVNLVVFVYLADVVDRLVGMPSLYPCDQVLVARRNRPPGEAHS